MPREKIFTLLLFIVIAAIFGFLGYKFAGPVQPTIVTKDTLSKSTIELPGDFPAEFWVDKDAKLVAAETTDSSATTIFMSKLAPEELQNKFISSIKSRGWKVATQNKNESSAQLLATHQKENFASKTVEFRATKFPDANTELYISYLK